MSVVCFKTDVEGVIDLVGPRRKNATNQISSSGLLIIASYRIQNRHQSEDAPSLRVMRNKSIDVQVTST